MVKIMSYIDYIVNNLNQATEKLIIRQQQLVWKNCILNIVKYQRYQHGLTVSK